MANHPKDAHPDVDPAVTMPQLALDPIFRTLTPVLYPEGNHATGFYYRQDGRLYLVTNRHVVATDEGDPIDDACRIMTRGDHGDLTFYEVDLVTARGEPTWVEHPGDVHVDLAAIPLDIDLDRSRSVALDPSALPPTRGHMPQSIRAMIVGYPQLEQAPYLPYSRDAIVATPYGMPYRGLPCFATDADMHAGTSGSPVFALPTIVAREGDIIGDRLHLIGVHSATLFSDHPPEEGSLDLNVAWYSQLITDILTTA